MSSQHLTEQAFTALKLPDTLIKGVEEANFRYCTPIQAEVLPPMLAGQDVAGQAQTGTGKTAAFLLAMFARLLEHAPSSNRHPTQPRALIMAPTRELAIQIHKDAQVLGRHTGFQLGLVYGGTGYEQQRRMLEAGIDILIGTPGRIIDYFKQRLFDLKAIQVFVLDEADRMFDLGFIKDVRFLLRRMPPPDKRLNMLFSATLSYRVSELAYEHMNNPLISKIDADKVTVDTVKEVAYYPANDEKIPLLIKLLKQMDATRTLVFMNTKGAAERVCAWLEGNDFQAAVLSGDVLQKQREHLLQNFKNGTLPILVATDVAARGLHIPDVSHVFNYDLPQDPEDYVHRIGRTARAGASGDAVSFVCEAYAYSFMDIQEYIGHQIPVDHIDPSLLPKPKPPKKFAVRKRIAGRGHSGKSRDSSKPATRRNSSQQQLAPNKRSESPALQQNDDRTAGPKSKPTSPRKPGGRETPAVG